MKKFLAIILATMMLLSSAAFATEYKENIEVRETTDNYTGSDVTSIDTPKTELWLQVDATGQIDVTVPLVLIFQTNIDGGTAQSPDTYKITNNSTADLVVTKIAVAVEPQVNNDPNSQDDDNPMELVAYTATPTEDQYKVQLSVNLNSDGVVLGNYTGNTGKWDLFTPAYENLAKNGGLFELKKAAKNGAGTDTRVYADMSTGALSFVTKRIEDDTAVDTTKGVKLLTVTYTVAIDTSDAIGVDITTTPNNPQP